MTTHKVRNYSVVRGANLSITVDTNYSNGAVRDISSGYTLSAELKKHYGSSNVTSFDTSGAANGQLTISLDGITTANLSNQRYDYVATITETSSNTKIAVQTGLIAVHGWDV